MAAHTTENHRLSRRTFLRRVTGGSAGAALGASALGSLLRAERAAAQPKVGGTLTIARSSDMNTFDVHRYVAVSDLMVTSLVFDQLVVYDRAMAIKPALAQSWDQPDPTTWRFRLRPGVRFTDGTAVNASAIKANYERAVQIPRAKVLYGAIVRIETPDDTTVVFKTATPFGPLLRHLATAIGGVMSPEAIRKYGADLGKNPVGSGPYKVQDFVPKERVVLVRNEAYWGKKPSLERIVWRAVPEEGTRMAALQRGEVDVVVDPQPDKVKELKATGKFDLVTGPATRVFFVGFNYQRDYARDPRVRQAIASALNGKEIVEGLLEGLGTDVGSFISPLIAKVNPKNRFPAYSVERAKQLLAQAGKTNRQLSLWTPKGQYLKDTEIAQVLQAQLDAVGIRTDIKTLEPAAFFDAAGKHEHDLYLGGWGFITGDADQGLRSLLHSKSSINYAAYSNPQFDDLLDRAVTLTSEDARGQLYTQVEDILAGDVVFAPFYRKVSAYGVSKRVRNLYSHPMELLDLGETWVE
jgi:peptide/nickel transport system substrate-binding protein